MMQCLMKKKQVQAECGAKVEWLMMNFVAPELQGGIAHLRARACWAMGHLSDLMNKESDFYLQVVRCVMHLLRDPELPVRFQVCLCVP